MSQSENEMRKSSMEGEHRVQLGLIGALLEAVDRGEDGETVGALLEQLIPYSEAHFLSEELLMRLASYDDYAAHAEDHQRLIDSLRSLQRHHGSGRADLVGQVAKSTLAFLTRHIHSRDAKFVAWERN